jgi:hypothetical protein
LTVVTCIPLVAGVTNGSTAERTKRTADSCAFEAATALVANDAANGSTT